MTQEKLTVLSLNMFGTPFHPHKIIRTLMRNKVRRRFKAISEIIKAHDYDVLILQEVHDFIHALYLRRHLASYRYCAYKYTAYGPRGGLMIFSKLPFEKVIYQDFFTQGQYHNKSITGYLSRKGVLLAKLKNYPLWVLDTHLTQNSDHDWSENNRYIPILTKQLEQLIRLRDHFTKREQAVILAGDFNMPKGTRYYHDFLKSTKLRDAFPKDSFPTYQESFLPKNASVGRLDFIFHSDNLSIKDTNYILQSPIEDDRGENFYLSDHIGLVTTFALPKS